MRLLTALTFASGALALATGPVQDPADQQTVQGDALLKSENAVLATPISCCPRLTPTTCVFTSVHNHTTDVFCTGRRITSRDETVSSSEVEKRVPGIEANIPMPKGPSPASVTIAGITVSFMMAHRWIQVKGKNVVEYYVRNVTFRNGTRGRVFVDAVANGLNFFTMRMAAGVQYSDDPPFGADTFKLIVQPLNDEL